MNRLVRPALRITQRRCASTSSRVTPASTPSSVAAAEDIPLVNLSLRWKTLTSQQKETVTKQLEQVQMGDWKAMTLEQKKAGKNKKIQPSVFSPLRSVFACPRKYVFSHNWRP